MFEHLLLHFTFVSEYPSPDRIMPVTYDYSLVVISYLVATFAGYTGLSLAQLVNEKHHSAQYAEGLVLLGSTVMGLGIWAMHFIAMLAYSIDVQIAYDPVITVISVLPAIIASLVSMRAMTHNALTPRRLIVYGMVIGLGIGAMHYIGMAAMIMEAAHAYHGGLFVLSLAVAWILGSFTLYIRFSDWFSGHFSPFVANLISAAFWGAAVSGMHYIGMAAAVFMPGEGMGMHGGIPAETLAAPVSLISLVLVLSAVMLTHFQLRLSRASREAKLSQQRMLDAIEEMSDGFVLIDEDGLIELSNRRMYKLFPDAEGLLQSGAALGAFTDWLFRKKMAFSDDVEAREVAAWLSGEGAEVDAVELPLVDEQKLMVRQTATSNGGVMCVFTDITAYKQAEEALYQEDKMSSMGRMVSGVAHEVNTPLGISLTVASQLDEETRKVRKSYDQDTVSQEQFEHFLGTVEGVNEILLANIRRAADLIRNFKQVAVDQSHLERDTIRIKSYTEQVIQTLRPEYKALKPLIEVNGPDDLEVETLPGAYSQVLINLIKNSVLHAFTDIEQPQMNVDIDVSSDRVKVVYRDNGVGMSKEVLGKIFDPFFTTKRQSGGTGLGMHIVFNLVAQKLRGSIKVNSEEAGGSEFIMHLPLKLSTV